MVPVMTTGLNLTNRLRLWRSRTGLTLAEVSDLTGYSEAMLSRAERGERVISPMGKVRVARCLGVPLRDLFEPEELPDEG
jgi:transcriptional regulator with XRE-family HTH domain